MIKKLGREVAIYAGGDFLFKIIAFAVFPIYAHIFSVSDFGTMALLTVSASLIGGIINLGINNSVQRYYWDPAIDREQQPVIVSTGLLQLISIGIVVLSSIVAFVYGSRDFIYYKYGIKWGIALLVICNILQEQILQYAMDTIRLHFHPVRFLIISFSKNLLGVCIGLWLVVEMKMGLYGFFLGALLGSFSAIPIAIWFIRKDLTLHIDKAFAKRLFQFGYPFVFTLIAYWVFNSMDRWMLAAWSNIQEVGIFSIAYKFAAIVTFISSAFGQAWSPHAIKLMRDDVDYRRTYSRIFSIWFFILAIIGFIISLFSKELLILLTPKEYWPATNVLIIITAGTVMYGTTQITALGISLEKKTGFLTFGAALSALFNLVLNIILIPRFGATGAAISTMLSYTLLTSTFLFWTQKLHPLPLEKRKLIFCCLIVFLSILIPFIFSYKQFTPLIFIIKTAMLIIVLWGAFIVGIINKSLLKFVNPLRI